MELDKRIANIADIYSVNDGCHDWDFMNKKGYFANCISDFSCLKKCFYGEYKGYVEADRCFQVELIGNALIQQFRYFIPEIDLKPVEKKYRPFSLNEFVNQYPLGDEIIVRRKDDNKIRHRLFIEYTEDETEVRLGSFWFTFEELFNKYEVCTGEGWKPFGLLEE